MRGCRVPVTSKQFELGFKWQPNQNGSLVTGSVFEIRRKNVVTADPDHLYNSVQLGEVRAHGLELEAKTLIAKQVELMASYAYLNTKVTQSSSATDIGRSIFSPKHSASLWLNYGFADPRLLGLSVSTGVRHVGKIWIYDFAEADHLASRTLTDLALRYEAGPVACALNVANLSDKISSVGSYFNQRRAINASVQYRW